MGILSKSRNFVDHTWPFSGRTNPSRSESFGIRNVYQTEIIVEYLNLLYNDLKELGIAHPYLALGLNTILIALFFIQLYYYLSVYGSLPHFRNNRGIRKDIPTPPISVIIVIRENSYYFIEETLP